MNKHIHTLAHSGILLMRFSTTNCLKPNMLFFHVNTAWIATTAICGLL